MKRERAQRVWQHDAMDEYHLDRWAPRWRILVAMEAEDIGRTSQAPPNRADLTLSRVCRLTAEEASRRFA